MHTHTSALTAAQVFLFVVLFGTIWRLSSGYLATKDGTAGNFGRAMAFQY